MKDKVKRFFIDKKELLIFIAVVIVVFATVITIASLALSDIPTNSGDPIINDNDNNDNQVDGGKDDGNTNNPVVVIKKFALPLLGEYEVIRTFFDPNLKDEELVSAVIPNGSYMIESKGMSYAKSDNSSFDCLAVYDGLVTSVEEDELLGTTITIKHSEEVYSIYSSLYSSTVSVGDMVTTGQAIAKASTSLNDVEAGVHVHLQIKIDGNFVNPANIFGKQMEELDTTK